jgi:hypothetical protein
MGEKWAIGGRDQKKVGHLIFNIIELHSRQKRHGVEFGFQEFYTHFQQ